MPSLHAQATVEQPRISKVLDASPTQKFIPAPPDGDDSEEDCDSNSEEHYDYSSENYDDDSEENYDDESEASYDDHSENNDDRSEETYDDHSDVSITQSPKVQVTVTEPVENLACKACGGYFATILSLKVHELREHTELCACQICERAGRPCSCGICKRASTVTVLAGDEKSIASGEPLTTAFSVDSPGVIEPRVIEDSSIKSQFEEPVDSLVDESRDFAEDAMASQHGQTLLDMECVVDGEPSSGLTSSRPASPPENESDGLDSSTCQIIEIELKEEGIVLNSVRLECSSVLCETDMLEHVRFTI